MRAKRFPQLTLGAGPHGQPPIGSASVTAEQSSGTNFWSLRLEKVASATHAQP